VAGATKGMLRPNTSAASVRATYTDLPTAVTRAFRSLGGAWRPATRAELEQFLKALAQG